MIRYDRRTRQWVYVPSDYAEEYVPVSECEYFATFAEAEEYAILVTLLAANWRARYDTLHAGK